MSTDPCLDQDVGRPAGAEGVDESCQVEQPFASSARRRSLLQKWRNSVVFKSSDLSALAAVSTHEEQVTTSRASQSTTPDLLARPKLPPELCDRIIDHLHNDCWALAACSMTCRAWLPTSRLHQFRQIKLGKESIPTFWTILTANPTIGPYVEDILIIHISGGLTIPLVDDMKTLQTLKQILDVLPSVKILRIPVFFRISLLETVILAALSKSLQAIFFSGVFIIELETLSELLASFPLLHTVSFSSEIFWHPLLDSPKSNPSTPGLSLRSLRVCLPPQEHGASDFVQWLGWCFKLPELRYVCVRYGELFWSHSEPPSGVAQLLNNLGPALEKLEIVMPRDVRFEGGSFDLRQCTKLKHIVFPTASFRRKVNRNNQHFFPTWAATFLSRVKTDSVRTITFILNFQNNDALRDLARIEEIALPLSCPEFNQLARLEFKIVGRFELQIQRYIREELPELCERGIVFFSTSKNQTQPSSRTRAHPSRLFLSTVML